MTDYSKIPYPVKILYIGKDKIFYKTSNNSIRVFLPKKLDKNNPYYEVILLHLKEASIQGSAFCWDIEDDEICIAKDTIHEKSRNIKFEELMYLLFELKQNKHLNINKLVKSIAQNIF